MSFSFLAGRSALAGARRCYSTAVPKAKAAGSTLPYVFFGIAAGSAGGYYYLHTQTRAAPKPAQEKSPLDPQNFIDFKLKKVLQYNHNTAHYSDYPANVTGSPFVTPSNLSNG